MGDLVWVRRCKDVRGSRVDVVDHAGIHHFPRALPPHLHVLGEIHLTHPAFAELFDDVIAVGDDRADQVRARSALGTQSASVAWTEPLVGRVLRRADRADLERARHTFSNRRTWSPTRIRSPRLSERSPRTAIATPLRLPASRTKNSLSSDRTSACLPLIVLSYGKIHSPTSRPMDVERPGARGKTSPPLPSART